MLTRDQILKADDLPMEPVSVPEWGGDVMVRTITGKERDHYELNAQSGMTKNIRAQLVALSVCDEAGEKLFNQNDVEALGKKSAKALDRLFDVAIRLNGIGDRAVEDAKKN